MRIEMEKEQEDEEREVEGHVMPMEEQMEIYEEDQRDQDDNVIIEEFDEEAHEDPDGEDPGLDPRPTTPVFGWREGLETFKSGLQVLRSHSRSPEKDQRAEGGVVEVRLHCLPVKIIV